MPEFNAAERGFTMPAEWEAQRAILLSWPLNPVTWEDRRSELEATYAGFAAAISHFEAVKINCVRAEQPRILKLLSEAGTDAVRVELLDVPTNDAQLWRADDGIKYHAGLERWLCPESRSRRIRAIRYQGCCRGGIVQAQDGASSGVA